MCRWEDDMKMICVDVKIRRCEDVKMYHRPPRLEEPLAQTLSGKKCKHWGRLVAQSSTFGIQHGLSDLRCASLRTSHRSANNAYLIFIARLGRGRCHLWLFTAAHRASGVRGSESKLSLPPASDAVTMKPEHQIWVEEASKYSRDITTVILSLVVVL